MIEKHGLDKSATSSSNFNNKAFKESKERKNKIQKIKNFNNKSSSCENLLLKDGEKSLRVKICWCKLINKSCNYSNCPNI